MLCVSARFVALLGLRRPEHRQQPQWPVRLHLCGGGCDQSARWRRIRRARGERGVGTGAPASLLFQREAHPLLTVFPTANGMWRPGGQSETSPRPEQG